MHRTVSTLEGGPGGSAPVRLGVVGGHGVSVSTYRRVLNGKRSGKVI